MFESPHIKIEECNEYDYWNMLPTTMWIEICSYLPLVNIISFRRTSMQIRKTIPPPDINKYIYNALERKNIKNGEEFIEFLEKHNYYLTRSILLQILLGEDWPESSLEIFRFGRESNINARKLEEEVKSHLETLDYKLFEKWFMNHYRLMNEWGSLMTFIPVSIQPFCPVIMKKVSIDMPVKETFCECLHVYYNNDITLDPGSVYASRESSEYYRGSSRHGENNVSLLMDITSINTSRSHKGLFDYIQRESDADFCKLIFYKKKLCIFDLESVIHKRASIMGYNILPERKPNDSECYYAYIKENDRITLERYEMYKSRGFKIDKLNLLAEEHIVQRIQETLEAPLHPLRVRKYKNYTSKKKKT